MSSVTINPTGNYIDHPKHFDFQAAKVSDFKNSRIAEDNFHTWIKDHMYRSSYINHYSEKPVEKKNTAIPGYAGYIPTVASQSLHGKGYTSLTKQAFNENKLANNPHGLASTGFNVSPSVFIDNSKLGSSHKYGKTCLQTPHPAWIVANPFFTPEDKISTTHSTYVDPRTLPNPTFRPTDKQLQTQKHKTKRSGFGVNYTYLDGHGWNPNPVMDGPHDRTEYRDRLNAPHDFHRDTTFLKSRTLPKKSSVYEYNV